MADKKDVSGNDVAANGPDSLVVTEAEAKKVQHDGALDDVKETAKAARRALTDGNLPGEAPKNQYLGYDEIQMWADIIDLGVEAFEDRVSLHPANHVAPIPDNKVYGLLALERNGQNRTPYVKACMKRLKLKADELPGGGPDYTNDVTNITSL